MPPDAPQPTKRPLKSLGQSTKLTKPFRSPLVRKSSSSSKPSAIPKATGKVNTCTASPSSTEPQVWNGGRVPASTSLGSRDILKNHDDGTATNDELYKQYIDLSRQLTQMRQSLDTAQQALNILKTDQEQTMKSLIDKWTGVVRETAEELFEDVKSRAEHEEKSSRPRQPSLPFDNDDRKTVLNEEQQEMLRAQQEEDRAQALKYGLVESTEASDEEPEQSVSLCDIFLSPLIHLQSFTMATMLRQMDVDLALVGYDEKEERFIT